MYAVRRHPWLLISSLAAVLAVGCGDGSTTLSSPTAPSALSDAASLVSDDTPVIASTESGAEEFTTLDRGRDKDKGKGGDKGKGNDKGKGGGRSDGSEEDDDNDQSGPGHGNRGRVSGFVMAVGTDSITIGGIVVTITPDTVIRHGGRHLTIADIHMGDHAQARGTMSADGQTLTATEVKVEDTGRDNDEAERAKVEGLVSEFSGTTECPNKSTFTVGTTKVTTNSSTRFERVTCQTLANGMRVEVEGMRQTDGSILATRVERELDKVEGVVSDLSGTCTNGLTFMVGTTKVTTTSTTTFSGGACAALMNLTRVEVEGTKQSDGSIAATHVKLKLDEVEGTISGLDTTPGNCPSRTFTVGTTKVTTGNVTTFSGVTCAALADGTKVEVKGTKQADGSIAAAEVELD